MTEEFAVQRVALELLTHLESHRERAVRSDEETTREVEDALEPMRRAYRESELPLVYWEGLERELSGALPAAWRQVALPFTALEARQFGLWRGGDLVARLVYALGGLVLGGLFVWLPFVPVWEKWVPFAMTAAGAWLPTAQVLWHRRRYARELGRIASRLAQAQGRLEAGVTMNELLPPPPPSQPPASGNSR